VNRYPALLLATLAMTTAGCGARGAAPTPATSTPAPLPTATVSVGFLVQITPVPTRAPKPTPRPTATPFRPPKDTPYLALNPAAGPPASRTITVRGGGLPPSAGVSLVWAAPGQNAGVDTSAATGRHGRLWTRFTIPASPPGVYDVLAEVNGTTYASAHYTVVSMATLAANVTGGSRQQRLSVYGNHFLPGLRLALIAYPVGKGAKPVDIGTSRTSSSGKLSYSHPVRLPTGQYILRAWSTSGLSSQMAETFFQVIF
jgi:hypothetical protein